jgi:outer membrane biosynthesis protein TonB
MRTRNEIASWGVVVIASLGLHAVAFGGIGGRSDGFGRKKERPATLVEMSVAKPKEVPPAPPVPKVEHKSAPRLALSRPTRTAVRKASAPPPPAADAPPPEAETLADFTGVTMTNDGPGAGWSSATGNGQAMKGAVGRPGARVNRRTVDGDPSSSGRGVGPKVVSVGDLSRRPSAPDLTQVLARAYPDDARKKGISGQSLVRARITPDGHVAEMVILSESTRGFGAACQRTLHDSVWSPPLDRNAHPVSTFINYTCRFEVL